MLSCFVLIGGVRWPLFSLYSIMTDVTSFMTPTGARFIVVLWFVSGMLLAASCLMAVGYIGCDVSLAVFFIITGVGSMGLTTCITSGSNQLDLAPPFAGHSLHSLLVQSYVSKLGLIIWNYDISLICGSLFIAWHRCLQNVGISFHATNFVKIS